MRGCAVLPTSWCSGHEDGVLFVIDTAEPCKCWQLLPFLAATLPFLATTLPFFCWQLLPFLYWQLPLFLAATFAFPWCSLCLSLLAAYALLCCNVTKTCMQPKRHLFQVVQVQVCQKLPCLSTFATGFYESHVLKEFAAFSYLLLCLFGCLNNTSLLCRSVLTLQWGAL